jgi:hypothetical protein
VKIQKIARKRQRFRVVFLFTLDAPAAVPAMFPEATLRKSIEEPFHEAQFFPIGVDRGCIANVS